MPKIPNAKLNKVLTIGFIVLFSAILMAPSNPIDNLPGQDNGVFLYAGQQILQGDIPYRDFWDHKGPLIFYLNAFGLLLASMSRWGVWFLELIFLALTAFGIYQIAERRWSKLIGILTLVVWFILIDKVSSYVRFGDSNYTETYALLFSVSGILFYLWSWEDKNKSIFYFLIGICAGLSFALRPNNISIFSSIIFIELFGWLFLGNKQGLQRMIALLIGWLLVLVSIYFYFWSNNSGAELLDAVLTYNVIYSQKNNSFENRFIVFWHGAKNLYWIPLAILIVTVGQIIYSYIKKTTFQYQFTFFLLLSFILETILSSLSGRALLHYYISWIPIITLLIINFSWNLFLSKWINKLADEKVSTFFVLSIIILSFSFAGSRILIYFRVFNEIKTQQYFERQSTIIEFIKNTTKPEDTILVWGNDVWINFLANRESPTKYAYQYPLFLPNYTNHLKVEFFLKELKACPPIYILEPIVNTDEIIPLSRERIKNLPALSHLPDGMQDFFNFFQDHYSFLREFNEVIIYKWNGKLDLVCQK